MINQYLEARSSITSTALKYKHSLVAQPLCTASSLYHIYAHDITVCPRSSTFSTPLQIKTTGSYPAILIDLAIWKCIRLLAPASQSPPTRQFIVETDRRWSIYSRLNNSGRPYTLIISYYPCEIGYNSRFGYPGLFVRVTKLCQSRGWMST